MRRRATAYTPIAAPPTSAVATACTGACRWSSVSTSANTASRSPSAAARCSWIGSPAIASSDSSAAAVVLADRALTGPRRNTMRRSNSRSASHGASSGSGVGGGSGKGRRGGSRRNVWSRVGMLPRYGRIMTMDAIKLAGGGAIPLVGFGTWQLRGDRAYDAVRHALEVGYRHIDTATMYGNEAEVGRAMRDSGVPREEVFVTTKLPPRNAGRERATIAASLRALDTGYVDLWLIHWPPQHAGLPSWREFLAVQAEGLARAVGVSNYDLDQLDALTEATGQPPAVNQIPWSPRHHDPAVLAGHRERGIVLEGYSPLKGTRLDSPAITKAARRHGVTPAQVVLRWHLEHQIPVIPKSARRERIASNFDLSGFTLSAEETARIEA
jgi:2,5-diketo-D-gluconate reductase A